MWKTNLGADVTLDNQEWQVFLSTLRQKNYDVGSLAFQIDFDDPVQFLRIYTSNAGDFNDAGYASPAFDDLIAKARLAPDWPTRNRFAEQAERQLLTDMPNIPLFTYSINFLVSPRVTGWIDNQLDTMSRFMTVKD
jgi:oligopeptide transport system substrate-binding protein